MIGGNLCRCTGYQNIVGVGAARRRAPARAARTGGRATGDRRDQAAADDFAVRRRVAAASRTTGCSRGHGALPRRPRATTRSRPRSCAARTPTPGSSTSTSRDALDVDGPGRDLHLRGPAGPGRRAAAAADPAPGAAPTAATGYPLAQGRGQPRRRGDRRWSSPRDRYLAEDAADRIEVELRAAAAPWSASTRPARPSTWCTPTCPATSAAQRRAGGRRRRGRDRRRAARAGARPRRSSAPRRSRWRAGACWPAGTRDDAAAADLDLHPDLDRGPRGRRGQARPAAGQRRRDHPGRRRRLRRQDHAPVAGGGPGAVGGAAARAAGQVDRGPARALHRQRARARRSSTTSGSASTTTAGSSGSTSGSGTTTAPTSPYGLIVPIVTSTQLLGPYKPGAYRVEFDSLYTNTVIVTPYRGAGRPQGVFVMERTMDAIAGRARARPDRGPRAQLHPARRDALRPGADLPGRPAADLRLRRLPGPARQAQGPDRLGRLRRLRATRPRAQGRRVGIGLACYVEGTGVGPVRGRPRAGRDVGQGQGGDRAHHPGPGPPDGVRADRRRRARGAARGRRGDDRRHPPVRLRGRHVRLPRRGDERLRGRAGRAQGPGQGAADRGGRAGGRPPTTSRSSTAWCGSRATRRRRSRCGTVAVLSNPLRYAFDEAAKAATQFAGGGDPDKPPVAEDDEPGLEGRGLLLADALDVRHRDARGDRRDRPGHGRDHDPALLRGARLRPADQPADRRGPDPRRRRAGRRRRAVRADGLRRRTASCSTRRSWTS